MVIIRKLRSLKNKRTMKVKNKTQWLTRDLKRILCEALRRDNKIEGELTEWQRKRLTVEIVHARYNRVSGYAWYNSYLMRLRVPKEKLLKKDLVWLFIHELTHIRGYKHKSITRKWEIVNCSWVEDNEKYPLGKKVERPKPKTDLQLKRYTHVLKMISKKETALKRLNNSLKRWKKKQKYYEKVLITVGKLEE